MKFAVAVYLTVLILAKTGLDAHPLEFRGILRLGEEYIFSVHDQEVGLAAWLREGESEDGLEILAFNPNGSELQVRWRGEVLTLALAGGSSAGLAVEERRLAPAELSSINQELLSRHKKLVKLQTSAESGREVRDSRVQKRIESFLLTNPSVAEFHDFLPSIQDSLDFEEFMEVEFPDVIHGRNKQNTARWGVDKFVDQSEIEELLAYNPTAAQVDALLREK